MAKLPPPFTAACWRASIPVTGNQHFAAQHLLDCPNEQLRAAGLSHNKSLALRDLAAKTLDGTVPTLAVIRRMSDEAIVERLTQVRGIGKWTVEMLLIFRLGRADVFPTADYGVRKGFALTFGKLKPTGKVTPMDLPSQPIWSAAQKNGLPGAASPVGTCGEPATWPPALQTNPDRENES